MRESTCTCHCISLIDAGTWLCAIHVVAGIEHLASIENNWFIIKF